MLSSSPLEDASFAGDRRVTAVLGPTNTGKTHYAIERMLAHQSGMIGLPLRLLAREIYDRIVAARGPREVALVTGEEKIIPPSPRYWVATVEAMPLEREVEFLAIDEIQLSADPERGRIFTSRLLHARGKSETLFLGSDTMRPVLRSLFRDITFVSRDRFSKLSYTGPKKASRLPRRTAIVAFSSDAVYAIAELIRRQRGGAAVVLGALSPRTRNAQAELYQSGEVDFLVATDAIGMGLNMDIDHVAFAARRKFDGRFMRNLTPAELAQVAGRAGRHINDGSFGVTADCPPLEEETVLAIEDHQFEPVKAMQWRTETIDLSSLPALLNSLERPSPRREFIRSRREDDEDVLHRLTNMEEIRDIAKSTGALATLWDICQIPDFRKVSPDAHARLLGDLYLLLMREGRIADAYLEPRINRLDRTDGEIDTLSSRIAHIRTWNYLSHRAAWIENSAYWQERARTIEDKLSDALHEKLTQRFVDRRTSTLIKRLKDDAPLLAGVTDDGEVIVEGQFVGRLMGFDFIVDPRASGAEAKSLRAAGEKALRPVLAARAAALANAGPEELNLADDGVIWWRAARVAHLRKGPSPLRPEIEISGLDQITANMRGRVEDRIRDFVAARIEVLLGPLIALQAAANTADGDNALSANARGVAFRLVENFGAISRTQFGNELKQIEQDERAKLRKLGMRFGEYTLHVPMLLKPAPASLLTLLWALWSDRNPHEAPPPKAGLVSLEMSEQLPHAYYYAAGYRPSGTRAVRIDMLERLANLIRTARNDDKSRQGFEASTQMMSLVGCSGEEFEAILKSLGFKKHMVKRKAEPPAKPETSDATANGETPSTDNQAAKPAIAAEGTQNESAPDVAAPSEDQGAPEGETTPEAETAPQPAAASDAGAEQTADDATVPAEATNTAPPPEAASPEAEQQSGDAEQDKADKTEPEEIEVALWRMAPRRPPQRRQKSGDAKQRQHQGKKGQAKGGGHKGRAAGGGNQNRKPRPKKADPNSPFAVLAGLKSELANAQQKKPKAKEPEKTE